MFLQSWVEMGGFELNHHWHGINVLSIFECCLLAGCLCAMLTLLARYVRKSRRLTALALAGTMLFATAAYAANTALSALTASGALAGANLIYVVQTVGVGGVKATMTQVATFINSLFSGDCTVASGGAVTCTGPTHLSGTAPSLTAGTVTTNANLTGDVTSSGNATTLTNAPVIAKVLTGFTSGAGTVSAADSILSALQKINGNDALKAPLASPTFTGTPAAPTATVGTNTTQVATTAFVLANAGSGTGANPTATAGPTAVNGSATTFMRSDGAPAVQTATAAQKGVVQGDGATTSITSGVISVPVGCGLSTASGTAAVSASVTDVAVSGTTDTIANTECGTVRRYTNSAATTVTVPSPSGFAAGFYFTIKSDGANTGGTTVTPGTTIDGSASNILLAAGQSLDVYLNASSLWATLPGPGTKTIASGTATLGTSAIASGACATVVTVSAAGVATTDIVTAGYNGDPTAVTGYGVSATGAVLSIYPYPTSGNMNAKVCNSTSGSITPSALTINLSVKR